MTKKIRILYVTPYGPSLGSGGGRHCFFNLRSLCEYPGASVDYVGPELEQGLPGLPESVFTACFSRRFNMLDKFKAAIRGASTSLLPVYMDFLKGNSGREYDIIFVESTRCSFVFEGIRGKFGEICSVHNVEADYMRFNKSGTTRLTAMNVRRSERRTLRSCNTFLVMHEEDRKRLKDIYGSKTEDAHFVHHPVSSLPPRQSRIPFEKRTIQLCFVGSLDSKFNETGLQEFMESCWQRLKSNAYSLTVAGKNPPPSLVEYLNRQGGVRLIANPLDMESILREARILILPDITGTGMKLRVAEAMSLGVPVVGTRMGLKGYRDISRFGRQVETVPEMGQAIIEMACRPHELSSLSDAAVKIWQRYYSPDVHQVRLHNIITGVISEF